MATLTIINAALLIFLVIISCAIIKTRKLVVATFLFGIFSVLMALLYVVMGAPDVAMTEAVIGACVSPLLLLATLLIVGEEEKRIAIKGKWVVPVISLMLAGFGMVFALCDLPEYGSLTAPSHSHVAAYYIENTLRDTGSPNMVTAILASYRGFDTLGETIVVFTALIAIWLLLPAPMKADD